MKCDNVLFSQRRSHYLTLAGPSTVPELPITLVMQSNQQSAKIMHALDTEVLWDEGIASYLADQYARQNAPLTSANLQRMASEQAVRVGDMLETLFLMSIYGIWHYCNEKGEPQELNEDALNELYAKGRIGPEDMKQFDGVWIPSIRELARR